MYRTQCRSVRPVGGGRQCTALRLIPLWYMMPTAVVCHRSDLPDTVHVWLASACYQSFQARTTAFRTASERSRDVCAMTTRHTIEPRGTRMVARYYRDCRATPPGRSRNTSCDTYSLSLSLSARHGVRVKPKNCLSPVHTYRKCATDALHGPARWL